MRSGRPTYSPTRSGSASISTASPKTCATHVGAGRVAEDVDSADLSGVSGTPTFFINGRRHYGAYDIATLSAAVRVAGAQALAVTPAAPRMPPTTNPTSSG